MRKLILATALLVMVTAASAASLAWAGSLNAKLPKCSMPLCRDVGCSPDVLCVSGAHVKTCAEVCSGH
jgi:hypothetical protein